MLEDKGPLSCSEIAHELWLEMMYAWSEAEGVLWDEEASSNGLDRLRARCWWLEHHGDTLSMSYLVDPHLRALERAGTVSRIQIEGHRPMLWRIT